MCIRDRTTTSTTTTTTTSSRQPARAHRNRADVAASGSTAKRTTSAPRLRDTAPHTYRGWAATTTISRHPAARATAARAPARGGAE
eukprot:522217-Pyramimonas_sp.AAC.1